MQSLRKALAELAAEREVVSDAIAAIESFIGTKRVVRAPAAAKARGRKSSSAAWTPQKRKAAAERMRRYWAARRKAKK